MIPENKRYAHGQAATCRAYQLLHELSMNVFQPTPPSDALFLSCLLELWRQLPLRSLHSSPPSLPPSPPDQEYLGRGLRWRPRTPSGRPDPPRYLRGSLRRLVCKCQSRFAPLGECAEIKWPQFSVVSLRRGRMSPEVSPEHAVCRG